MYPREPRSTATARVAARASRAHSFRSERGFTLIEVLAACAVISIGVASTLKTFGATGRTVTRSERTQVAIQRAQSELDRMRTIPYGELALTSPPATSSDPKDPGIRVENGALRIRIDLTEPFVTTPAGSSVARVDPAPRSSPWDSTGPPSQGACSAM